MDNFFETKREVSSKKRKDSKLKRMIIILVAILFLLIVIERIGEKTMSKDKLSLIVENADITAKLQDVIIEQNGIIFLSFDDVKNIFDKTIFLEDKTNYIITTGDKKVAAFKVGETTGEINGSKVELTSSMFKTEQGKIYLPVSELRNVYDLEFSYVEETKNILMDYYSKELKKAEVTKNSNIKNSTIKLSKTIDKVKKGEEVVFISTKNGWSKIRTNNGMIGYIRDNLITNIKTIREDFDESKKATDNNKYLEKSLTKTNIETYEERKKLIQNIIAEAIKDGYNNVKISYEKNDVKSLERFKIESKPMLKECGINIEFE